MYLLTSFFVAYLGIISSSVPLSKKNLFREYTPLPFVGKYSIGDTTTSAVFLGKANMKIVELQDSSSSLEYLLRQDDKSTDVYERRVALEVIAVPLLRPNVEVAISTSLLLLKPSSTTTLTSSAGDGALLQRDGGLMDNMRFIMSQGIELGQHLFLYHSSKHAYVTLDGMSHTNAPRNHFTLMTTLKFNTFIYTYVYTR